jgi:hypothetical protein
MKTQGFNVNTAAIAQGIYQMICDREEEAIVAFGMIPKWAIDSLETELRRKIVEIAANQTCPGATAEDLAPYVSEEKIQAIMRPIVHEITCGIYAAAKHAGKMMV